MDANYNIPLRNKLVFQLGVPFLVFTVAAFMILTAGTLYSFIKERKEALDTPEQTARNASRELGSFFAYAERTLEGIAKSAQDDLTFSEETALVLGNIVKENFAIRSLAFFDKNGGERFRAADPASNIILEEAATVRVYYFSTVQDKGENHFFLPQLSSDNTPVVFWVFPVRGRGGEVVGIMSAGIDVSSLWEIVSGYREAAGGDMYIVDETGVLLISGDTGETERQQSLAHIEGVQRFLARAMGVHTYTGLSGTQVAGAWEPLPPTSWGLVSEVPLATLFAWKLNHSGLKVQRLVRTESPNLDMSFLRKQESPATPRLRRASRSK